MDYSNLIEEIARRVAAKLETAAPAEPESASDAAPAAPAGCEGKPRLLILTQEHGAMCHDVLSSTNLLEYYHTECALMQNYEVDLMLLRRSSCSTSTAMHWPACPAAYAIPLTPSWRRKRFCSAKSCLSPKKRLNCCNTGRPPQRPTIRRVWRS